MMPRRYLLALSVWVLVSPFPPFARAGSSSAHVRAIRADGTLELANGDTIRLGGLRLTSEAVHFLSPLLAGKEIELEYDPLWGVPSGPPVPKPAYVFVKTQELDFPFSPRASPRQKSVMVNQLLLGMGVARVDKSLRFKRRDEFFKIEAEARQKGEGLWSYEHPLDKAV